MLTLTFVTFADNSRRGCYWSRAMFICWSREAQRLTKCFSCDFLFCRSLTSLTTRALSTDWPESLMILSHPAHESDM